MGDLVPKWNRKRWQPNGGRDGPVGCLPATLPDHSALYGDCATVIQLLCPTIVANSVVTASGKCRKGDLPLFTTTQRWFRGACVSVSVCLSTYLCMLSNSKCMHFLTAHSLGPAAKPSTQLDLRAANTSIYPTQSTFYTCDGRDSQPPPQVHLTLPLPETIYSLFTYQQTCSHPPLGLYRYAN